MPAPRSGRPVPALEALAALAFDDVTEVITRVVRENAAVVADVRRQVQAEWDLSDRRPVQVDEALLTDALVAAAVAALVAPRVREVVGDLYAAGLHPDARPSAVQEAAAVALGLSGRGAVQQLMGLRKTERASRRPTQ